jgi:hypothetical protein
MTDSPSSVSPSPATNGALLAGLTFFFYGLWTLLPNSNSWMVGWPWVVLWQAAVLLPVIGLFWQGWHLSGRSLGYGWNLWCGSALIVLLLSSWGAEFPALARWYGVAALGGIATLYGVQGWLRENPEQTRQRWHRLLQCQTVLVVAFISLSLGLWTSQTYLPELSRLQILTQYGTQRAFDLNVLELRNWYPLGHQNYVAGFLVLNLPLLVGWGWNQRWPWRILCWGGTILGLGDLYTTGSRAGGVGLAIAMLAALILLGLQQRPQRWQWVLGSGVGALTVALMILGNDRLRNSLRAIAQGNLSQGELAYRWITAVTGWAMGASQPWTGLGLGSVPLTYQRYRPGWAGKEAELIHQLHNTPIQLWAELGIGGLGLFLGAIALLFWTAYRAWSHPNRPTPRPLLIGTIAGLAGYGFVALTDYQLDNIAISGSLILAAMVLITAVPGHANTIAAAKPRRWQRRWVIGGIGGFTALTIALVPFYRAWGIASQGFVALENEDIAGFVQKLEQAHYLAPWQPYYPYQLGWKLGDLSLDPALDIEQRQQWQAAAIAWFEQAIAQSPHLEFGYSSLGWLQGDVEPVAAAISFTEAAQLVPAKAGVFFGLGIQCLRLNQPEAAISAFVLESARHPLLLTSPLWQQPNFQEFYPAILAGVETLYSQWLVDPSSSDQLRAQASQVRGALRWWQGNWAGAEADWTAINQTLGLALVATAQGQTSESVGGPGGLALQAWQQPEQRQALLTKAWTQGNQGNEDLRAAIPPPELITVLVRTMGEAQTFLQWLQNPALTVPRRYERLGFGVLSRYIDGPQPVDYWVRLEQLAVNRFFPSLFPSPSFLPELDQRLQPLRSRLLEQIRDQS